MDEKTLNVGITGLSGFIGTHLRNRLHREAEMRVLPFADEFFTEPGRLGEFVASADAIVHLAATMRGDPDDVYDTNVGLVQTLIDRLRAAEARPHMIFASSTQIDRDNAYGRSKKEGARLLGEWAARSGAPLSLLVVPNVFGGQGQPHHNSVVATFCHQLAHGEEPQIHVDAELDLIYVQELVEILIERLRRPPRGREDMTVAPTSRRRVSAILALLQRFQGLRSQQGTVPAFAGAFERQLYHTFMAYRRTADYEQPLVPHSDPRGILFEIVRQEQHGHVHFSTTHPGIVRGNHYHTRKLEKFCVVRGEAVIRLRRLDQQEVTEYRVSGDAPVVIDIPIYHTHHLENVGTTELLTLFWSNEPYDPADPDSFPEEV